LNYVLGNMDIPISPSQCRPIDHTQMALNQLSERYFRPIFEVAAEQFRVI
jgi:hypothetical protein